MKASALKKIADNLGRFASVREAAPYPTDRILVQSLNGELKLIAIAPHGTIVAYVGDSETDYRAIINARDFLQLCKNIPAKADLTIKHIKDNWHNGITINDEYLERIDTAVPADAIMPKIEPQDGGHVIIPDSNELGKMADALSAKWSKGVQFGGAIVTGNEASIKTAIWDNYKYGQRRYAGNYEVFGWVAAEYIAAARGVGPYRIDFDPANSLAVIRSEGYVCYGRYNFLDLSVPLSEAAVSKPNHHTVVDRSAFIKQLREHVKLDEHERVVLQLDSGTLRVLPYEEDTQMWGASGRFLIQLLSGTSTSRIGFGLREPGGPISLKVDQWQIELAPVVQLKKKSTVTLSTIQQGILDASLVIEH